MNKDKDYLSQGKFEELTKELEELKTTRRKAVAERLEFAKSMGDLSENAEYHSARDEQADIEERISQLEIVLKSATILTERHGSQVEVGSKLTVKRSGGSNQEFTLVGSEEADIKKGKISYQSPLGEALLGKKAGETVKASTPNGEISYTILSIN
ncbi:MAG: transcription elongation factor GreA [Patescibacteria group bacterium]